MNLVPHSIRWRMQLWHGALLALVLAGFTITAWRLQWNDEMRRVDTELQQQVQTMLGIMHGSPNRPPHRRGENPFLPPLFDDDDRPPRPPGMRTPEDLYDWATQTGTASRYYKIWTGPEQRVEDAAGLLAESVSIPEDLPASELTPLTRDNFVRGRQAREVIETAQRQTILLAGRTLEPELEESRRLAWKLTALGTGVWLLAFFGGGWLTRRALHPIQNITSTATRISSGHLDERINVDEADSELGQLAGVLNDTFARLQQSFDQQAQFTADAAHELRTPISVLLSQTQLALARERSPEEYRKTLEACQRSAKRMHALTESLLELAKLDASTGFARHQPIDLSTIARDCIEHLQPLADAHSIRFESDLKPSPVHGDENQLSQIFTNLLSNALHHSPDQSVIRICTGASDDQSYATITDKGPGIAAEHLPHLFDRFYRADTSRNRSQGGAGLGLAICQTIAKAHGGQMIVTSEVGHGSTFGLNLPLRIS